MSELKKTNHAGYFVNENGAVIRDDEIAWMSYKVEREKTKLVMKLVRQVENLSRRVMELEKRVNETATIN